MPNPSPPMAGEGCLMLFTSVATAGIMLAALYGVVRFVKWAWMQ